ncbi:MAG: histidine phosphatase family protein [Acidobacteria bacterium]|nr:histidine phosphatase family protein [Acidobacteriota bacterium]MBI3423340.1 histidine phosphatase family protein [Acidobacteriota bacterium]
MDAVYAGNLHRSQQTAQIFSTSLQAYSQATVTIQAEIVVDERWREFSLATVYRGLAAKLCADEAGFAEDFAEMQTLLLTEPNTTRAAVERCDRAVIQVRMENRYPEYASESWLTFRRVVESSLPELPERREKQIAIFTSATPIAIWTGLALGLTNAKILSLTGVLNNAGITTFKLHAGELRLLSFNNTSHLTDPALRTFR